MGKINGTVQLNKLSQKEIFLELGKQTKHEIQELTKSYFSIKGFCKEIGISERIILHWINNGSFLRLDVFNKLEKRFQLKHAKIVALRGKVGGKIENPKFPFDFTTTSGARFIASILGDGGLSRDYRISYANTNKDLIKGFVKDSKNIFGSVKVQVRKTKMYNNSYIETVSLPPICGKILSKVGLKAGKKVSLNQRIPGFILNLSESKKWAFLSQLFDDEGTVNLKAKYIRIKLAIEKRHKKFYLIEGIVKLFESLGIKVALYNAGSYNSKTGFQRTNWSIQIDGSLKLKNIYKNFNLRHKAKEMKFHKLISSFKLVMFPRNEFQDIYLSKMELIEKEKGFFTVFHLSKVIDRNLGHIRNVVHKFNSLGLIECIKPYSRGYVNDFSKYRVMK